MALAPASNLFQHPGCPFSFSLSVHFAATHVKSEMGGLECVCGAAERAAAVVYFLTMFFLDFVCIFKGWQFGAAPVPC